MNGYIKERDRSWRLRSRRLSLIEVTISLCDIGRLIRGITILTKVFIFVAVCN